MKIKSKPLYLTIHGHFYQPPRENPWTGVIELQESALPSHDWNERIAKECYTPNASSRILNEFGRIKKVINNYEYMSFNIGPTLMSWIRVNEPDTYRKIIEADKKSAERLDGHGNAVAQVYNHMIMPLASPKDRLTQIRWGIADFESHFDRKPESMWLAETAINMDTVVDLINEGIKFVILSPTQAEKFRELKSDLADDTEEWQGCENTDIDTTRPYRIVPRDEKGELICEGYLDVFFYDAHLSSAVGFEHLLKDANLFTNKILGAFNPERKEEQLISIGTDGESYGHHEAYGDMCAAYIYSESAPANNMVPVNYAWFLEKFPPKHEVVLKNSHSEGCAWSCAHGVGRWYRDCGCSTGGPGHWDQKWRGPLRNAFDMVNQKANEIYEAEMKELVPQKDPWEVRDEYAQVLIRNEDIALRNQFLKDLCGEYLSSETGSSIIRLLEAQKFSLYSYTSCGWFFNDILGLEPVQNMRYALRSMELLKPWIINYPAFENEIMEELAKAKANQDDRNGADIFRDEVIEEPSTLVKVAAGYALTEHLKFKTEHLNKGSFTGEVEALGKSRFDVKISNSETSEVANFAVMVHHGADLKMTMLVLEGEDESRRLPETNDLDLMKEISENIENAHLCKAQDLISDTRTQIVEKAAFKAEPQVEEHIKSFLEENKLTADFMLVGKEILGDGLYAIMSLGEEIRLKKMLEKVLDTPKVDLLIDCKNTFKRLDKRGIKPSFIRTGKKFSKRIGELILNTLEDPSPSNVRDVTELITLADFLRLDINRSKLEDMAYEGYLKYLDCPKGKECKKLRPLFEWLNFDVG